MRIALMIEAQMGLTYAYQLTIARRAEAAGLEALFRSDHYESFPGHTDSPTTDAWAVLAGLARETERIGLGVLVSPVAFRHPGNVAKLAATVQEMSGGRLELGLGAGWHEDEHRRHGFTFPPISERADLLEEQLAIVRGLLSEPDGWSFSGAFYQVEDARFRARPEPIPPIIVGGEGSPRGLRIAARWADEFNLSSSDPDLAREKMARLDAACRDVGRDPATLRRSAMVGVVIGRDRPAVDGRLAALVAGLGKTEAVGEWLDARRSRWIIGTPDEARATVRRFADAGVERILLQDFLPNDLEMIDEIGEELVGRV
jgi:F420-dependent oxidoreductase-like protein